MKNEEISKKLNKEDFIKLFQFAFDTDIEKVLLTRNKVGISGGNDFSVFYNQITKISKINRNLSLEPNELNCILKFFDDKCYEKVEFPKDYELIFRLIKFAQKNYNWKNNVKKMTEFLPEILGEDLFLETSVLYFDKNNPLKNKNIKNVFLEKENIFSMIRLDYIHPYFILNTFNLLYKNHKTIEKDLVEQQVANIIAGRITYEPNIGFYKKLEKIDKYIGTSDFTGQFYQYNLSNKKFIDKVKLYKIECEYKYLNKSLQPSIKVQARKSMKI